MFTCIAHVDEYMKQKKHRTNLIKLIESNTIETMELNGFQLSSTFLFASVIIVFTYYGGARQNEKRLKMAFNKFNINIE